MHRGGQDCKSILISDRSTIRNASKAMDISADLQELARCPVGLVSAGVKSILDIGRLISNIQWMSTFSEIEHFQNFGVSRMFACSGYRYSLMQRAQETLGIPVVTYGETQDFPAFYSPSSGFKVGRLLYQFHNMLKLLGVSEPLASK